MGTFDRAEAPQAHINYLNELVDIIEEKYGDPDFDLGRMVWEMYCNEDLSFDVEIDILMFEPIDE